MTSTRVRSLAILLLVCLSTAAFPALAEEEQPAEEPQPEQLEAPVATSMTQTLQGEGGISVQTMCTNCNSADLSLGSFGNEFLSMLCDGLPVPAGLAQIYLLSVVPPWVVDNVAVERGAGRAHLEGGAVGGEIDVRRRAPAEGLQIDAAADMGEYGWRGSRAEVGGRVGWFGGTLGGTWAESDSVDADTDGNPDMASIDRTTWEGRFDLRPGKRHRLTLGASGYDESQTDGRAAYDYWATQSQGRPLWERERVELDREQYDLTYRIDLDDGSNLSAGLLYADRTTFIEEEEGATSDIYRETFDIGEKRRHARLDWFRPLGNRVVLRFGASRAEQEYAVVDFRFNEAQQVGQPDFPLDFALEESLLEIGAWVEGEFSLGGGVRLFAGLRHAVFKYTDNMEEVVASTFVSEDWLNYDLPQGESSLPRFALTWKPADPLDLRFSYGKGLRQAPPTHESVCCGRRYRDNRGLLMEESEVAGMEVTYQPTPALQLIASAFRSEFENLVVNLATWSEAYVPIYQNVNVPDARFNSLGFELRWDAARWANVRGSFSRTNAANRSPDHIVPVVYDSWGSPVDWWVVLPEIPYVPEREGSLGVMLSHRGRSWGASLDLSMQYAGNMPIQQFVYEGYYTYGQPELLTTPSFRVYNARASVSIPGGVDLFLGMDNIGDYVQPDLADPTTDYTWAPLRGRYLYGGATFSFATKAK